MVFKIFVFFAKLSKSQTKIHFHTLSHVIKTISLAQKKSGKRFVLFLLYAMAIFFSRHPSINKIEQRLIRKQVQRQGIIYYEQSCKVWDFICRTPFFSIGYNIRRICSGNAQTLTYTTHFSIPQSILLRVTQNKTQ